MKKIFYTIKNKIDTTQNVDLGVVVLFSIVTVIFLASFIKLYF